MGPVVNSQQHLSEEGRLRAGEIVSPVRVQYFAVFMDFVEKIVGHVLSQSEVTIAQQTHLDEKAVPAVHFVKAAPRDHVRPRQIQQTWCLNLRDVCWKRP